MYQLFFFVKKATFTKPTIDMMITTNQAIS